MVQAPVRVRVPIAEKYVNQRTQAFTRTHARSMQRWIDDSRGSETDYYTWYRKEVERTARKWVADCEAIDRDPNLSFREKRSEKDKLSRIWPSWTMEQEQRFIDQWGDPRTVDRSRLESLIADLESPQWDNAMRGGQIQVVDKKEWERKFYDALIDPQDGSVPLFMEATEVRVAEPVMKNVNHQTWEAEEVTRPVVMDMNLDLPQTPELDEIQPATGMYLSDQQRAQFQAHMQLVAKRTCAYCRTYFPKGLKPQHINSASCKEAQAALK